MDFIRFFIVLLLPGFIAARSYSIIAADRRSNMVFNALIFDLLTFIINITGLFYFKAINTMTELLTSFECLSFTRKYALLSILVGLILSGIFGIITRFIPRFLRRN